MTSWPWSRRRPATPVVGLLLAALLLFLGVADAHKASRAELQHAFEVALGKEDKEAVGEPLLVGGLSKRPGDAETSAEQLLVGKPESIDGGGNALDALLAGATEQPTETEGDLTRVGHPEQVQPSEEPLATQPTFTTSTAVTTSTAEPSVTSAVLASLQTKVGKAEEVPSVDVPKGDSTVAYSGGLVLTGLIRVSFVFYGSWSELTKAAVRALIPSLASAAPDTPLSTHDWWNIARLYTNSKGEHAGSLVLGEEAHVPGPAGIVTVADINALIIGLSGKRLSAPDASTIVAFLADGSIQLPSCSGHYTSSFHFVWAGGSDAASCGAPVPAGLAYPNGGAFVDGAIAGLAKQLVQTAVNPFGMSWQAADNSGKGVVDVCADQPRPFGNKYVQSGDNERKQYNTAGIGGFLFLLPKIWNPVTKQCALAFSVPPEACGTDAAYGLPCDGSNAITTSSTTTTTNTTTTATTTTQPATVPVPLTTQSSGGGNTQTVASLPDQQATGIPLRTQAVPKTTESSQPATDDARTGHPLSVDAVPSQTTTTATEDEGEDEDEEPEYKQTGEPIYHDSGAKAKPADKPADTGADAGGSEAVPAAADTSSSNSGGSSTVVVTKHGVQVLPITFADKLNSFTGQRGSFDFIKQNEGRR